MTNLRPEHRDRRLQNLENAIATTGRMGIVNMGQNVTSATIPNSKGSMRRIKIPKRRRAEKERRKAGADLLLKDPRAKARAPDDPSDRGGTLPIVAPTELR